MCTFVLHNSKLWMGYAKEDVINIGHKKLFASLEFNPNNVHHVLAAFSQRIGLELGDTEDASIMARDAIRSHMRIMVNLVGKSIVKTESPSEPILAIAASHALLHNQLNNNDQILSKTYNTALGVLVRQLILKDVVVERGRKGELCARLLLIMSIDLAIPRPIAQRFYVETVTLDRLLTVMLGDELGLPSKDPMTHEIREEMMIKFNNVHINVTHVEQQHHSLDEISPEYLLQLWCRGAAAQCTFSQPVIDMLIPAYSGPLDKPFNMNRLTYIVKQVKATEKAQRKSPLETLSGPRILSYSLDKSHLWKPKDHLVILLDLCANSKFKKRQRNSDQTQATPSEAVQLTYASARIPKPNEHGANWNGYMPSQQDEPKRYCLNIRGSSPQTYKALARLGVETEWEVLFNHTYNHDTFELKGYDDEMVEQLRREKWSHPAPHAPASLSG